MAHVQLSDWQEVLLYYNQEIRSILLLLCITTNLIFQKAEDIAAPNLILISKVMPVKVMRIMGENEYTFRLKNS